MRPVGNAILGVPNKTGRRGNRPLRNIFRFCLPRRAGAYSCRDIICRRRCREFLLVIEQSTGLFSQIFSPCDSKFGTSFQIPAFDYIKKKKAPLGAFSFLAQMQGFEPWKRFEPFTRFPIVLLRPARTHLHITGGVFLTAHIIYYIFFN